MTAKRIPVAGPWITDLEVSYAADAAANAWYETAGHYVARFERAFADFVGRRFAISLPSCTAGLHLSLSAMGVGPGDQVIVPDVTWIASSAPISYVGAEPVFVDIDPSTWCLSPAAFEAAVTPRTRAVIAVDLYGSMADMDEIEAIAARNGVRVIEDAAEAVGSVWRGRHAGAFGDTSVFSFHGSKTLTTGEGGMVLTDDEDLYERMGVLRDHGRSPGDTTFVNDEVAFKYKMSAMQAAVGLAQTERVAQLVERKLEILAWYQAALGDHPDLELNPVAADPKSNLVPWMTTVVFAPRTGLTKKEAARRLAERGIDTRPFFSPLSSLPAYTHAPGVTEARQKNTASYDLSPRGLNLPSSLRLTSEEASTVAGAVRALVESGTGR